MKCLQNILSSCLILIPPSPFSYCLILYCLLTSPCFPSPGQLNVEPPQLDWMEFFSPLTILFHIASCPIALIYRLLKFPFVVIGKKLEFVGLLCFAKYHASVKWTHEVSTTTIVNGITITHIPLQNAARWIRGQGLLL